MTWYDYANNLPLKNLVVYNTKKNYMQVHIAPELFCIHLSEYNLIVYRPQVCLRIQILE